ncbi:MAG: TrmB family transcriptional regulator [Candidatus Thorarchaeota archaeon]
MVDCSFNELISNFQVHNKLVQLLNLTQNEAKIYRAMYGGGSFTAGELSRVTEIHRSRIYDNLRGLEAKKLIEQTNMDPLRFSVKPPKNAIPLVIEALETEHRNHVHEVMTLGLELDAIYMSKAKSETEYNTRTISLADSILEINRHLESTRERVWVSKHTSGGVIDWFVLKTQLDRLVQSGVDVRFLTDRTMRIGYNSRILPKISLSYGIIDDISITFFFSDNYQNEGQLMISRNPAYVDFLEEVFLADWDKGQIEADSIKDI